MFGKNWGLILTLVGLMGSMPIWAQTPQFCSPPPEGLVGWWPGEWNAYDVLRINNGSLEGGVRFAPGMVGQAFSFNGVDGYVSIPDNDSLNPSSSITIEAWFTASRTGDYQFLVNKFDHNSIPSNNSYTLGLFANGDLYWGVSTPEGSQRVPSSTPPVNVLDGQFHHIAGTYDRTMLKVYLDGSLVGSPHPWSGPITASPTELMLGGSMNGGGRRWFLNGLLDEVALYNRALTDQEIRSIYTAGRAGKGDQRDRLRREYIDNELASVPQCSEFDNHNPIQCQNISFEEYNQGNDYRFPEFGSWYILKAPLCDGFNCIRSQYEAPLRITSGYRNPVHQLLIDPQHPNGRHVYGDAVDIHAPDYGTWLDLWYIATTYCNPSYIEPFDEDNPHFHVDWRPVDDLLSWEEY